MSEDSKRCGFEWTPDTWPHYAKCAETNGHEEVGVPHRSAGGKIYVEPPIPTGYSKDLDDEPSAEGEYWIKVMRKVPGTNSRWNTEFNLQGVMASDHHAALNAVAEGLPLRRT